jgi:threonine/homoserine/homoserine lactone efflux protein
MRTLRFDWRWIAVIAALAVLASWRQLPWQLTALVLGGGGVYLLLTGWRTWTRFSGPPSRDRVTYWRGQRIELAPQSRGPALPRLRDIGPAAIPLLIGGVMVLAALSLVLGRLGL